MKREPLYSSLAAAALDRLEASDDGELFDAVRAAIDVVCDRGDSAGARREQLRTASGTPVWKVPIRTRHDDWVLLWWPQDRDAYILFIGEL
mgnify:CR=1 FL=1